jgi:hypothetical protein
LEVTLKLKPTTLVLAAVLVIGGGALLAGGARLYRWITAPRLAPAATVSPVATATPAPTAKPPGDGWEERRDAQSGAVYLVPPPEEAQALRAAFADLLHRVRVARADPAQLRAYDRAAAIDRARAHLAPDVAWPHLETDFVFVYTALGDENPVRCADADHCRVVRAVLGIEAVLIFDAAMCEGAGPAPCLAPLADDQIDARDNLVTADFRRDPDGAWRLTAWESVPLPAAPEGW